jgi:hypothetical protein
MTDADHPSTGVAPGVRLARGVARHLAGHGFVALPEVTLPSGLRADLMAMGPKGEIWIVECKSSRADFRADGKWAGYLEWADRFFWAVGADFPADILPPGSGLILADEYGAEIATMPAVQPLPAARRKALTLRFARLAAARLVAVTDPGAVATFA